SRVSCPGQTPSVRCPRAAIRVKVRLPSPLTVGCSRLASFLFSLFGERPRASRSHCRGRCHRALLRELGAADEPPVAEPAELAGHVSAREREAAQIEYQADEICLAWLLDSVLYERGWETRFE